MSNAVEMIQRCARHQDVHAPLVITPGAAEVIPASRRAHRTDRPRHRRPRVSEGMSKASEWARARRAMSEGKKPRPIVFGQRGGAEYARVATAGRRVGMTTWHAFLSARDSLRYARWIIDTFGEPTP